MDLSKRLHFLQHYINIIYINILQYLYYAIMQNWILNNCRGSGTMLANVIDELHFACSWTITQRILQFGEIELYCQHLYPTLLPRECTQAAAWRTLDSPGCSWALLHLLMN
jgi:hypothetical protein